MAEEIGMADKARDDGGYCTVIVVNTLDCIVAPLEGRALNAVELKSVLPLEEMLKLEKSGLGWTMAGEYSADWIGSYNAIEELKIDMDLKGIPIQSIVDKPEKAGWLYIEAVEAVESACLPW